MAERKRRPRAAAARGHRGPAPWQGWLRSLLLPWRLAWAPVSCGHAFGFGAPGAPRSPGAEMLRGGRA
eukprot:5577734-Alexandrium_andersonii.AAC.1